jgi:paxillin
MVEAPVLRNTQKTSTYNNPGYPPNNNPQSGYPPNNNPHAGYPPNNNPHAGYPPNNNPHSGYPPNNNPHAGFPPNNNPHAVYNPPNNPHAVYNPNTHQSSQNTYNNPNNYNPNPAGRTNTNQAKPGPPRGGPSTRDLTALMDDLNSTGPVDNFSNPQPAARKPPEKLAKGVCAGCRKYISSTQKIQAMGREYHPEHFQCSTCSKVIGNGNFFEKEGQPQCETCYQSVFCSKCANCSQPITSHCVTALSQSWHPQCFVCAKCQAPFNNTSFFEKFGKPYCSACIYDLHAQRCRSCNQPIRGSVINALGTAWHPEHFVCQSCHQPFPGGAFYEVNGLPYCEFHYQSIR